MNSPTPVAIAVGSNLGDRRAHVIYAFGRLSSLLTGIQTSSIIETAPVQMAEGAPRFLNAAVIGCTTLTARALLDALLGIERDRGRERPFANASRILDLDLVLFGDAQIDEPGLAVPHPAFRRRAFVLEPLAEIAPDWRDPVTTLTMSVLLERLTRERSGRHL